MTDTAMDLRTLAEKGPDSDILRGLISLAAQRLNGISERMNAFSDRPTEGDWPYVWIDATDLKVGQAGRIVSVAVTIAVGVNGDGRRKVLGMATGASEAEVFWTDF